MGIITSRFRESKSTVESLEAIERDLKRLLKSRRENQQWQKRAAGSLLLYSVIVFIVAVVAVYFFYWPMTWKWTVLYFLSFVGYPVMVWLSRKALHWYFFKRLTANDLAANELREKRKLILEDVMEKETYKKAKEILERFDPARSKKLEQENAAGTPGTVMRQRVMPVSPTVVSPPGVRPMGPAPTPQWANRQAPTPAGRGQGVPAPAMAPLRYSPPPGPPMPRTVLPRERGTLDRLMDVIVGDGPQNRYALICSFCKSHNGMALPEEFEYLSFRCCYCYNMNQARKLRPFAPRLEFPEVPPQAKHLGEDVTNGMKASETKDKGDEEYEGPCSDSEASPTKPAEASPSQSRTDHYEPDDTAGSQEASSDVKTIPDVQVSPVTAESRPES